MHRCLAFIQVLSCFILDHLQEEYVMKKLKIGILIVIAMLALVSVASAIPATITLSSRVSPNGPDSYIRPVTVNGDMDVPVGAYDGWCVGFTIIGLGSGWKYNAVDSRGDLSTLPLYIQSTQWDKVNWIINNPASDWRITQAAIWKVDGGFDKDYPSDKFTAGYNEADFTAYMTQVNANAGYNPTEPGEYYSVILYKSTGQPLIIPAKIPTIPSPEFPTVALPIAMMISVLGVVYYIRTREE